MKMIKHANSLFKWPSNHQNGASKMTNAPSSDAVMLGTSSASNGGGSSTSSSLSNKSMKHQSTSSSSSQQQSNTTQKLWLHPPTTLQNGHIAYLVKYFGNVEVNQPKGIDVVKESINKLKYIQPLKKSEGNKIPKVELTISVNGVAIQEPKTKKIYCQFPLHRISYCADDKTEKKFFSFIAKDVDTDKHLCFVFMSEKMSEEIILTIGQAFDLAYAKFIETSGRELEIRKQLIILQKKVCHLEQRNKTLKERLSKYEPVADDDEDGANDPNTNNNTSDNNDHHNKTSTSSSLSTSISPPLSSSSTSALSTSPIENGAIDITVINNTTNGHSKSITSSSSFISSLPVPPALQPPPSSTKNRSSQQINLIDVDIDVCNDNTATLLDNNIDNNNISTSLITNNVKLITDLFDEDFNPRANDEPKPTTLPNNNQPNNVSPIDNNFLGASITQEKDIFGCEPFHRVQGQEEDPFGMPQFNGTDLDSAIVNIDKKLAEMRDGFSQGLSADGFNLDS